VAYLTMKQRGCPHAEARKSVSVTRWSRPCGKSCEKGVGPGSRSETHSKTPKTEAGRGGDRHTQEQALQKITMEKGGTNSKRGETKHGRVRGWFD